nr:IST1 homolog [Rhipicephalus microplus]
MFSSGPNYAKLKTNLRLTMNRLKLLERKKTELAQKARKEIAEHLANGKTERARIRVEHIIREDYLVEAMELVEVYCDLLLARFGLLQQMKTLDEGLSEAVSSLIWVAPRLQADVAELKAVADQLAIKYGKPYAQAARDNGLSTVSPKLMQKLSVQAPPRLLVEQYLIEIAKSHDVPYEPDKSVMEEPSDEASQPPLIDLGAGARPPGFISQPYPQFMPASAPQGPMNFPGPPPIPKAPPSAAPFPAINPHTIGFGEGLPPYSAVSGLPDLPSVPSSSLPKPPSKEDDLDFDDLTRRFEELKKRK